ncbi:phage holin, LLH family [Limosilactobacillus fermentum]|uniref:phage holin, LLH family n=1 Tax=Limosilactobacillus fermentum TaxID=1613 RepID=UPI003D77D7F0
MKEINDIVEWLIQSGALTVLVLFSWKFVKPWLDAKASHANTVRTKESWSLLEQIANISVTALVGKDMTGKDKFDLAVKHVMQAMHSHGFEVSQAVVEDVVQSAYEKSPLTGINQTDSEQSTSTVTVGPEGVTTTIKPADGTATAIDPMEAK